MSRIHPVVAVAKLLLHRHCDIIVNVLTMILYARHKFPSFPFMAGYDVFKE